MRRLLSVSLFVAVASAMFMTPAGATLQNKSTAMVSVNPAGDTAANATVSAASVSADGNYSVVVSAGTNLVTGFANGGGGAVAQIFERNLSTGANTLVSHTAATATTGGNLAATFVAISSDGRYVLYTSAATDLVTGYTGSGAHLFLFDRNSGNSVLVDHTSASATTASSAAITGTAQLALGGSRVAFQSASTDLVSGFVAGTGAQTFVYNVGTAANTLASHTAASAVTGSGAATAPTGISDDGSVVSETSAATDLVSGFVAGTGSQTFLYTVGSNANVLVSHTSGSAVTAGDAAATGAVTGDGLTVVVQSAATTYISGYTAGTGSQIFAYDVASGTISLVSRATGTSKTGGNGASTAVLTSTTFSNGQIVTFSSAATNLIAGYSNQNGGADLFSFNRGTSTMSLVSHAAGSTTTGANQAIASYLVSANSRIVLATTASTNLVTSSTGTGAQVFALSVNCGENALVSGASASATAGSNAAVAGAGISNSGGRVVMTSAATNVVSSPAASNTQAYAANLNKGTGSGYWMDASDGGIFSFGSAQFFGSAGALTLNKPVVGMSPTSTGAGYWLVASDGGVFSYGDAAYKGSTGGTTLNKPVVGMSSNACGAAGYWLVASDGGVFSYGSSNFFGSTGAMTLNQPIVGMASTPTGNGYWLVASDGGVFAYGDAAFQGSTGALHLNKPIVGMAATPSGGGYWLVASDGGVFSFGDAHFYGSTGAITLNKPVVGMSRTSTGSGYYMYASDGGVFSFGNAVFYGSTGAITLNKPVVGGSIG